MICQRCGQANGTIQIWDIQDGVGRCFWLCPPCAADAHMEDMNNPDEPEKTEIDTDHGEVFGSFLGDGFAPTKSSSRQDQVCLRCGFSLDQVQRENRLGCPQCYNDFRRHLKPGLMRQNRRVLHVGRVPRTLAAEISPQADLVRLRIALEQAIKIENYEDAARLRDKINTLSENPDRPQGGSQ